MFYICLFRNYVINVKTKIVLTHNPMHSRGQVNCQVIKIDSLLSNSIKLYKFEIQIVKGNT